MTKEEKQTLVTLIAKGAGLTEDFAFRHMKELGYTWEEAQADPDDVIDNLKEAMPGAAP